MMADALKGALAGSIGMWVMDRVDWFNFEQEDPAARRWTEQVRSHGLDPAHVMALYGYLWQAHARGCLAHLVDGLVTDAVVSALEKPGRPIRHTTHKHPLKAQRPYPR